MLCDEAVRRPVERLQAAVQREFAIAVGAVRILDQLIWFDWNLAEEPVDGRFPNRVFADWVYDPRQEDLCVHRSK